MRWGLASTFVLLVGCRSPAQIDVSVTTNVACTQVTGTSVTTGVLGQIETNPPTSTTANCANEYIGSVVLVPSGDDGELVAFKVVTAINGTSVEQCTPDGTGSYGANCIVARRALRYLPHTPLQVNVLMSGDCAGKACDSQSTCVEGTCVPATIGDPAACEGSGCNETVLAPGGETPDATVPADASTDGSLDATLVQDAAPLQDAAPDVSNDAATDSPVVMSDSGVVPGCDMGGALANAAWPMTNYCPTHRNRSPLVGPIAQPASPRWQRGYGIMGSMLGAPAIGPDGTLYFSAAPKAGAGTVFAVDPGSGAPIWTYAPDGGALFPATPVLAADGTVRVTDQINNTLTLLYVDGGAVERVVPLASGGTQYAVRGGATIVSGGTQYASDVDSNLIAYDSTGSVSWAAHGVSSDFIYPTVAADGTILTVGGPSTGVVAFVYASAPDGGQLWAADCGAPAPTYTTSVSAAPDGSYRVVDTTNGILYAFHADGSFAWRQPGLGTSDFTAAIAIADDGTTYVAGANALSAWDSAGTNIATYPTACYQPVIDATGAVFAVCDNALVKLDSALNRTWSVPLTIAPGLLLNDSPIIGPGNAIYLSFDEEGDAGTLDTIIAFGP